MEFAQTTAHAVDDSSLGLARWEDFLWIGGRMIPMVIFLGAGLGGVCRHALGSWVHAAAGAAFPWGTLLINVTGSILVTFVYALLDSTMAPPEWRAFVGIGFLGGYTTFSTFSYEAVRLVQDGQWERALLYVGATVFLSLVAAVLGFRLASAFLRGG
jgi:CrcB protein